MAAYFLHNTLRTSGVGANESTGPPDWVGQYPDTAGADRAGKRYLKFWYLFGASRAVPECAEPLKPPLDRFAATSSATPVSAHDVKASTGATIDSGDFKTHQNDGPEAPDYDHDLRRSPEAERGQLCEFRSRTPIAAPLERVLHASIDAVRTGFGFPGLPPGPPGPSVPAFGSPASPPGRRRAPKCRYFHGEIRL